MSTFITIMVLIGGFVIVLWSCLVMGSRDDDRNGRG